MSQRAVIVEDEAPAAARLTKLLHEAAPEIVVEAVLPGVKEAVQWFNAHPAPDLAFFDIRLTDGDSFSIFSQAEVACPVIFITAYDEHALRAFRVNALDYLLKPLRQEDLAGALARWRSLRVVRDHRSLASPVPGAEQPAPIKRFLLRFGDHFRVVDVGEVAYLYARDKTTYLRTWEGRDLPLDDSLDRLERQLDAVHFHRVNRQLLVHVRSIKELLAYSKSRVKVLLEPPYDHDAVVSSERSASFKRWLGGG